MSLPAPAHDLERLVTSRVPVVLVDAYGPGVPCVVTDDVSGGRLATEHLVALGHRRIGFIGDDPENPFGFVASAARQDGCEAVLAEHGLELDPELVRHGPHDRSEEHTSELQSLMRNSSAVFCLKKKTHQNRRE